MVYSFGFVIWFLDIWILLRYFEKCNRLGEFMGLKYVFLDLRLFHTNRRQPNCGKEISCVILIIAPIIIANSTQTETFHGMMQSFVQTIDEAEMLFGFSEKKNHHQRNVIILDLISR